MLKNKLILIFLGIFLFSLGLRLFTLNQIGRTWDEPEYVDQGYKMIELMKRGDFGNPYLYTTYTHPPLVKYIYGLSAHLDVARYLPNNKAVLNYDLTYSRILSAIIFSLGVVMIVFIGLRFFSPTIGVTAGIILSMLPFTLGLSQLVTTESFKIFIYPLAIYSFILLLQKYSIKKLLIAGVITGIALQIKQSDGLLIVLFGLISLSYYLHIKKKDKKISLKKLLTPLIAITAISIVVFVVIWPQMLFHLREIYEIHHNLWHIQLTPKPWMITVSVPEIFLGKLMLTPTFYYIIYFFITIPIIILLLFFVGVKKIINKNNWIFSVLLLWFLVPFTLSVIPWRQHGLRSIIEIYPAIALIAAIGFDQLVSKVTKNEKRKLIYFVPVIFYLFLTLWQIKPYYLDYFNELVGGTNTVYQHRWFQQGWWGQGLRESGLYLEKNAPKNAQIGLAISPDIVFPKFDNLKYSNWSKDKKYDYVVVNYYHIIRDGFDDSKIRKDYKLIYTVRADNAVLVFIYEKK